jgi:antitoxin HicB
MANGRQTLPRFEIRPLTEEEGSGYLISWSFQTIIADGDTPEAALQEGRDAPRSYIETLKALGREIPQSGEV